MNKLYIIGAIVALMGLGTWVYFSVNINEVGLQLLSWVKKIRGEAVDLETLEESNSPVVTHQIWTELLQKHVDPKGRVSYSGFQKDSASLGLYLEKLSSHPPGTAWSDADRLAYWINAYNAFTIQLILDHYPLQSIKDISDGLPMINSPWDIKFFQIGAVSMDLNTIEHEILRKQFDEPRIHFAINCASISCPILRNEAYTAPQLEAQLEEQASDFINDSEKNRITEKGIQLSKIFDWFQSDFTRETDLLGYLQAYRPSLNKKLKVEFLEYDWDLNE